MKINIVTNCTARKAYAAPRLLHGRSLPKGPVLTLAKEWKRRLKVAKKRVPAGELYQGRAFQEASKAARLAQSRLYIVSAGLGLITEKDCIPPYSLTASEGHPDAVSQRVDSRATFRSADWWCALASGSFVKCIRNSPQALFVLALSTVYLQLLVDDLMTLTPKERDRIRLIGPRREADIPAVLRHIHMPYDDRLDGVRSPIRGTESDFPQRAALHFVQMLLSHSAPTTPAFHKGLVRTALANWPHRNKIVRRRLPEAALRRAIADVLRECDNHWSTALRKLRDIRKIACEQKRFRAICKDMLQAKG